MKRAIFALLFMALASSGVWADRVWRSSYTATADTTQNLCMNRRGILHGVIVSSGSASSNMAVYASSGTAFQPIAEINTTAQGSYFYDVIASTRTGLTYSTVGTAKVTILYDCF